MNASYKNKTRATLLAALLGGIGAHRFYLYGKKDRWAWVYVLLFPLSVLAGVIAALAIGLTPDEKWDASHNHESGRTSSSGWPLVIILVLTFAAGATGLLAAIARLFDLLYTGGTYG